MWWSNILKKGFEVDIEPDLLDANIHHVLTHKAKEDNQEHEKMKRKLVTEEQKEK